MSKKVLILAILGVTVLGVAVFLFSIRERYTQPTPFGFDANKCQCKGLKMGEYCYGKVFDCLQAESIPDSN